MPKGDTAEDFTGRATPGCTEVQTFAYFRGLSKEAKIESLSEAVMLFWAPQQGAPRTPTQVDVRAERSGLWTDQEYLWQELERLLLAVGIAGNEEPLYDLDWAKGQRATEGEGALAHITPSSGSTANLLKPKMAKDKREEFVATKSMDGATWNDIVQITGPGFSAPVLCDVLWKKSGGMTEADKKAVPHIYSNKSRPTPFSMALLEFQSTPCPQPIMDALKSAGCKDRLTFDAGTLNVQRGYLDTLRGAKVQAKAAAYDILFVPISGKGRSSTPVVDTPSALLAVLKFD